MLQHRRGSHRRISLKRRLACLGAWLVVITAFIFVGGIFFMIISGMKNVCAPILAKEKEEEISSDSEVSSPSNKHEETGKDHVKIRDRVTDGFGAETIDSGQADLEIPLVNKEYPLSDNYLVSITALNNGQQVAVGIYEDLRNMLADGEEQQKGLSFLVASGHRTKEKQEQLVQEEIEKNMSFGMTYYAAYEDAMLTVAPSGYSEHETGLAVDIVAKSNQRLDETQEYTAENQWLQRNCYKYGFILRYPKGKEEITGFSYESWHFRYVGKKIAKEITEKGITLEEYLE